MTTSLTERGLLLDMIEHPEDDGPRLIYADWYDDHGQPQRAEFIRVQIALARTPPATRKHLALEERQAELLATNRRRWEEPVLEAVGSTSKAVSLKYRRGFIECASVGGNVARPEALFHAAPIRLLWLEQGCPVDRVLHLPELARLDTLSLHHREDGEIAAVANCAAVAGLLLL